MTSPTQWTLYTSNEEAWEAILADCAKAQKSIVLEQFIFIRDDFGNRLIDICAERAAHGVDVRFLWDASGSFLGGSLLGFNIVEDLRKKHIRLLFWKHLIPGYFDIPNFRSWFLRNHRRTIVIDETIGYTGSICIKDSMKGWRDTNARFVGPIVAQMLSSFERMWARADDKKHLPPRLKTRDTEFAYVTNSPTPGKRRLYRTVVEAIRNAQHYIYITTPYFVPTSRLARVIRLAAHRGVDVRIIIPEKTNHYPALDLGARSFFTKMLESGVRIFLYPNKNGETLIHSKAIVIDGEWSSTGSLNLDNASLLYNYEANIVSTNSRFAEELAAHFVHDMHLSREVNPQEWNDRFFLERLPEYAIRLVRKFL
ncbi:MAG TPA: phospholipase D-like domain-containing protein [Candidatus Paceibacterota bacterium]